MPDKDKLLFVPPPPANPVGCVNIVGANTAEGKTSMSGAIDSFFQAAGVPRHVVRIESARRRGEFPAGDSLIDLEAVDSSVTEFGGKARLFSPAYDRIKVAIERHEVVIDDCGAGGQNFLIEVAGGMALDRLMAQRKALMCIIVVFTPDAESARQAAVLVAEIRQRLPRAQILLARNHPNRGQRPGMDTPQSRSANAIIKPLRLPVIEVPFCDCQALDGFAKTKRSFLDIMKAEPKELVEWTGEDEASTVSAQLALAGWWRVVADQLARIWHFDDAPQR